MCLINCNNNYDNSDNVVATASTRNTPSIILDISALLKTYSVWNVLRKDILQKFANLLKRLLLLLCIITQPLLQLIAGYLKAIYQKLLLRYWSKGKRRVPLLILGVQKILLVKHLLRSILLKYILHMDVFPWHHFLKPVRLLVTV